MREDEFIEPIWGAQLERLRRAFREGAGIRCIVEGVVYSGRIHMVVEAGKCGHWDREGEAERLVPACRKFMVWIKWDGVKSKRWTRMLPGDELFYSTTCRTEEDMELLNHGEKEVIRKFAAGDRDLRAAAVKVYEEACGRINASRDREWAAEHRESVHMSFMREITSKCPDLMLRHQARLDLVGADNMPKATWPKEMK